MKAREAFLENYRGIEKLEIKKIILKEKLK